MQNDSNLLKSQSSTENSSSKNKSWWESKLEGRKLAVLWFITTICGMLFITITSDALRLLIPVAFLFFYSWYGFRHVQITHKLVALRQVRMRQLADSIYFLGFLWTLFSLIDSFVLHKELSAAEAGFRAFGYALITTATGMFLRLFIIQFTYSIEEQAHSAEQNIEEEITRFTKELIIGKESINSFHNEINSLKRSAKTLGTSLDEIKIQVANITPELSKSYKDSITSLEVHSKNSISDIVHNLDLIVLKNQLNEELPDIINNLKKGIVETTKSIENTNRVFKDSISTQLEVLKSNIKNVSDQIAMISVSSDTIEKNVDIKVAESIKSLKEALEKLSDQFNKVRIAPEVVEKTVAAGLEQKIQPFQEAIGNLTKQVEIMNIPADLVEKTVSVKLEKNLKAFQEAIGNLTGQIEAIQIRSELDNKIIARKTESITLSLKDNLQALQDVINYHTNSIKRSLNIERSPRNKQWWKFWK
jgi:archaellum component FlaC